MAKAAGAEAVLESSGLSEAITRLSVKLIEYHGKAGYDAMGNVPKKAMEAAIEKQLVLNPSTRELVLFLAEHKPRPEQAKEEKSGWQAVDRYFWGYMDTRHFTKFTVPESEGFKGSKSYHEFVGTCKVAEEAEKNGPLRAREMFCACDPCLMLEPTASCKPPSAALCVSRPSSPKAGSCAARSSSRSKSGATGSRAARWSLCGQTRRSATSIMTTRTGSPS